MVYAIGYGATPFRRWPDRTFRDLGSEAVVQALADAGLGDGERIESVWFGNCGMASFGQRNVRGQVVLAPLRAEGVLPAGVPTVNVEGGCATGSAALHGAYSEIAGGVRHLSLAVGVEKTFVPDDPAATLELFLHGADCIHPDAWRPFVAEQAAADGDAFRPHPHRIPFVDVHALRARAHMRRHGTTRQQLAEVAAKAHRNGALNPMAQRREPRTAAQILEDRHVVDPLTRAMCAPIGDGAAAVLLCSASMLAELGPRAAERAVEVRASVLVGGTRRGLGEPGLAFRAAAAAYAMAGITPQDVGLAEVHDATSYCEIEALEALGLCPVGSGGAFATSGRTERDGELPVNPSGGLVARGHPLAATGIAMVGELMTQLRGEAGARQIGHSPSYAVHHNAGGLEAIDEALCGVTVCARPR